ncbi:MAG: hypothetical protein IJK89_06665 [Clostridia bacterium]|nr:hypothetical protein [Clostridia bacterium]
MFLCARRKMKGKIAVSCLRALLPGVVLLLGGAVAVPAFLCFVYGTDTVLAYSGLERLSGRYAAVVIPVLLLLAGTVIVVFALALAFYAKACIYYSLDRNQTRPKSLLRPSQALRYCRCRAGVTIRGTLWLLAYAAPAAALFFALRYGTAPWLTSAVRAVLWAADAVFAAVGLGFFAATSSRYYLADYLLYLNPLMPPEEAIRSSVRLTQGKLLAVTVRRLSLLPWALTELLILPLPFAAVYRRFCAAVLCERLFGEDKRRVPRPAVVFYVNRRSRFREADASQS